MPMYPKPTIDELPRAADINANWTRIVIHENKPKVLFNAYNYMTLREYEYDNVKIGPPEAVGPAWRFCDPYELGEATICIENIDTNVAAIAYLDEVGADTKANSKVVIATADGCGITFSDPTTFIEDSFSRIYWISKIDTNKFIVFYNNGVVAGKVGTWNGSSVSWGDEYEIYSYATGQPMTIPPQATGFRAVQLDTDKCLVLVVRNYFVIHIPSDTNYLFGMVCTVSGTVITTSAEQDAGETIYNFAFSSNRSFDAVGLDTDKAVVMGLEFNDEPSAGGYQKLELYVVSVSGTTISYGARSLIVVDQGSPYPNHFAVDKLSTTAIAMKWLNGVSYGTMSLFTRVGTIAGTDITLGDALDTEEQGYDSGIYAGGDLAVYNSSNYALFHLAIDDSLKAKMRQYLTGGLVTTFEESFTYDEDAQGGYGWAAYLQNDNIMLSNVEGTFPNQSNYIRMALYG